MRTLTVHLDAEIERWLAGTRLSPLGFHLHRSLDGRIRPELRQAVSAHATIEHVSMSESEALAAMVANAILIQDVW